MKTYKHYEHNVNTNANCIKSQLIQSETTSCTVY